MLLCLSVVLLLLPCLSASLERLFMTLVIHEMLRKTRQGNTTQQKDKATQHNLPKAVIFKKKLAASGGT